MSQIHPNVQEFKLFAELNKEDDKAVAAKFQTTFNTASLKYSTSQNIREILDLVFTVLSSMGKNTPLIAAFINAIKYCEDIRLLKDLDHSWEMIMADCKGKTMGKFIKGNLDARLKEANLYTQEALGGYPGHADHTQGAVKPYTGQAAHAQTAFKSIFGGAGPAHVDHAQRFLSGQSALATHTFGGMGFGQPAMPTHPFGIASFGQPACLPMEPFGGAGFDRPEVDSVESLSRRLEVAKEAAERQREAAERQRQNNVVATNTQHVQSLATATDSRFNVTEVKLTEALEVVAKLQSALATLTGQVNGLVDDQATQATKTAALERATDKNALGVSEVNARVDQSDAKMNRATESTNALMMQMMQAAEADREAAKADREAKEARRVTKEAERHAERLANKAAAERAAAARYAPTNSKAPATTRPTKTMTKRDLTALAKAKALVAKHAPAEDAEEEEAEEAVFDKSDDEEELDLDTGKAIKKAKHG
jgi:hypothetical protein